MEVLDLGSEMTRASGTAGTLPPRQPGRGSASPYRDNGASAQTGAFGRAGGKHLLQHRAYLLALQERARKHQEEETRQLQRAAKSRKLLAHRILSDSRSARSHSLPPRRLSTQLPGSKRATQDAAAQSAHGPQSVSKAARVASSAPLSPPARGRRQTRERPQTDLPISSKLQRAASVPATTPAVLLAQQRATGGKEPAALHLLYEYKAWRDRRRIPHGTPVFCMGGSGRHSGMVTGR